MKLLTEIRACTLCAEHLPHAPKPILTAVPESKIILIGQAPGREVHTNETPWADASGRRLREWLDVDEASFYDTSNFGIIPMGFCYPGKGKTGDLPPRKECAPLWHARLLEQLPHVQLTILIGSYAQKYYLKKKWKKNLTETVRTFEDYLPSYFPIVHPSPLNYRWFSRNPWFDKDVLPVFKERIASILK